MDASVAAAKKCTQDPRHNSDDNRAPKCAPKMIDVEAGHDSRDEQEQQTIRDDASLTDEQKAQKLEAVLRANQNALRKLLGEEIFQRYLQQNTKP